MTQRMKEILDNFHKYNMNHMANINLGLEEDVVYDALVVAPSYSVAGTLANTYLKESIRDYVPFEKIYPDTEYVDSIIKLAEDNNYKIRKASVFCTDSIAMEYTHLEEIKSFNTDLIEMETSTFYEIAKLMEIPAIALLVVSDNSATGVPLVGRSEEIQKIYDYSRKVVLIDLIYKIVNR